MPERNIMCSGIYIFVQSYFKMEQPYTTPLAISFSENVLLTIYVPVHRKVSNMHRQEQTLR